MKPTGQLLVTSTLVCVLALVALRPAAAQAAGWSGWARCEISTKGPGYEQTDTHTWFVTDATGNTSATLGSGSWHVAGKGSLSQGNPAQTAMRAEWAINGASTAASNPRFGVVPLAGGLVSIRPFHTQLKMQGGVVGYVQQTINNSARTPTAVSGTAWEWQFPTTVQGPATNQTISGTLSGTHPGIGWGFMQASGSTVTSSCSWVFANGSTPSPPPPVAPQPAPVSPGSVPPPPPPPPPSDPCQVPTRSSRTIQIAGLVPRSFKEGERVTVCGSQLSMAVLEDQYADSASMPSLGSPSTATFVLIGHRSLMALDPVISRRGDRIEFTAGGLYERSELTQDYDVLIPVTPMPRRWTGEFALRLKDQTGLARGPRVNWSAR